MRMKSFALAAVAVALVVGVSHAKDETVPFPVHRSQILRAQGTVYTITGRQTIPAGVEVSCQKDVYIKGVGTGATLVVIGSLQAHGVHDREIIFENVVVEPGEKCEDLHLDSCIFRGGGIISPKAKPVKGKIFLELLAFSEGSVIDLTMSSGHMDLSSVETLKPTFLRFMEPEGSKRNKCKVKVRGSELHGGLHIENAADVTVRRSSMGGDKSTFKDNDILTFDGNMVTSKTLEFIQTRSKKFGKTKILKCDIYSDKMVARAPKNEKTSERVYVDKGYFKGKTREKQLRTGLIVDGKDDPENAAVFKFKKFNERPLELAGAKVR